MFLKERTDSIELCSVTNVVVGGGGGITGHQVRAKRFFF